MDYSNPQAIVDRMKKRSQIISEIKQAIMDKDLLDMYGINPEDQQLENKYIKNSFKDYFNKHPNRIRDVGMPIYEAHPEYDAEIDKFMSSEHCHPLHALEVDQCECSEVIKMFFSRPIDEALKNVLLATKQKEISEQEAA